MKIDAWVQKPFKSVQVSIGLELVTKLMYARDIYEGSW
jgi:hypothetical protein